MLKSKNKPEGGYSIHNNNSEDEERSSIHRPLLQFNQNEYRYVLL